MRRILPRIASQNQTGHWSLYPPVSIPHWLRVVPTGSNSITRLQGAASPTQRFQWQKFWRGLNETEVRCCHHEVSLSLHRTAISCSCNQKWTKGTWHWTLEVSAILAKEFSQFLYKVLGSIFCPQSLKHLLFDSLQKVPCPGLGDWSRKSLGNSETRRKQKK